MQLRRTLCGDYPFAVLIHLSIIDKALRSTLLRNKLGVKLMALGPWFNYTVTFILSTALNIPAETVVNALFDQYPLTVPTVVTTRGCVGSPASCRGARLGHAGPHLMDFLSHGLYVLRSTTYGVL